MPLSLLNHSALALFAQRTRIPTSARSIGFCAIWVCISSSSSYVQNCALELVYTRIIVRNFTISSLENEVVSAGTCCALNRTLRRNLDTFCLGVVVSITQYLLCTNIPKQTFNARVLANTLL